MVTDFGFPETSLLNSTPEIFFLRLIIYNMNNKYRYIIPKCSNCFRANTLKLFLRYFYTNYTNYTIYTNSYKIGAAEISRNRQRQLKFV
jgi:hypothetical protein